MQRCRQAVVGIMSPCCANPDADQKSAVQSADFARQADEVMYEERDRLRTSLLSSVTVLQIQHALGIFSNWLQVLHC